MTNSSKGKPFSYTSSQLKPKPFTYDKSADSTSATQPIHTRFNYKLHEAKPVTGRWLRPHTPIYLANIETLGNPFL